MIHFWLYINATLVVSNELVKNKLLFYGPKILICFCIWVILLSQLIYVRYHEITYPTKVTDIKDQYVYKILHYSLLISASVYLFYLAITIVKAMNAIRRMKKIYKYVVITTLVVVLLSMGFLYLDGIETYASAHSTTLEVLSI